MCADMEAQGCGTLSRGCHYMSASLMSKSPAVHMTSPESAVARACTCCLVQREFETANV